MNNNVKVAIKNNESVWFDVLVKKSNPCDEIFLNRQNRQETERAITPAFSVAGLSKEYDAYILYSDYQYDPDKFMNLFEQVENSTNEDKAKVIVYYAPSDEPTEPNIKAKLIMHNNRDYEPTVQTLAETLSFNDVIDLAAFKYLESLLSHDEKPSTLSKHS